MAKQSDYASKNCKEPRRLSGLPMCRNDAQFIKDLAAETGKFLEKHDKPAKKKEV